jgi:putative phosphoesterase
VRIALLSDVHANLPALEAALRLCREAEVERLVVAGDLVGDGPHPVEVLELLRRLRVEAIRGNVDRKVVNDLSRPERKLLRRAGEGKAQQRNRAWTALRLDAAPGARAWLESLPAELRLVFAGHPVLVVHGSPHGDTDYVFPSLTARGLARKLEPLEGWRPDVLVCGHSHVPFTGEVDGVRVVNCGSVGRPADGDPRGSLALLELVPGEAPRAEVVRFDYDVEALARDLAAREVPGVGAGEYRRGVKG